MEKDIIRLAKLNSTLDDLYEEEVVRRVRTIYSINKELAILRQRDKKPEEFAIYNAFVEECKAVAKKEIYGEGVQQ